MIDSCRLSQSNVWGNYWIIYYKTNEEFSTAICSVVKHLGSARALKKENSRLRLVFSPTLRALPLPVYNIVKYWLLRAGKHCEENYKKPLVVLPLQDE